MGCPIGRAQVGEEPTPLLSGLSDTVCALFDVPAELNALDKSQWMPIETVIHSGAADSVALVSLAKWLSLELPPGSVRGLSWKSASDQIIHKLGQRHMQVHTEEGNVVNAVYRLGEVDKPLGLVSRTCDKGNRVVFEHDHGYIESLKTGEKHYFPRRNNVYVRTTWIPRPRETVTNEGGRQPAHSASGFTSQG